MKNYSFLKFPNFLDKAVTLSYDDGTIYDKQLVKILDKYGLKCTFNLNSELFAEQKGGRRMTASECYELLNDSMHEVACHGARHLSLGECNNEQIMREVTIDRINLEKLFNKVVCGFAYANGSYSDVAVDILSKCNIKYARTVISTNKFDIPNDWLKMPTTCHHTDEHLLDYVDDFLSDEKRQYFWSKCNAPKLFYLWGHSYEFNDSNNWYVIEDFCKKIGGRNDIYYATNVELYDYVKAFENLEYSIDGKIIFNPSSLDVYYNHYGKNIFIGAGKRVDL